MVLDRGSAFIDVRPLPGCVLLIDGSEHLVVLDGSGAARGAARKVTRIIKQRHGLVLLLSSWYPSTLIYT